MLNTPVLLLVFNRPDTTIQVFEKIREAKPKQLFVAADGPRSDREGEKEKCEKVRKLVLDNIDWDCEVKTLFQDSNLGCGRNPSKAIAWFFDNVSEGIVLEDDIVPSKSFFFFCQEMLIKYRDDTKIMNIGGTNFLQSTLSYSDSYLFSNYSGNWGWASWKRAWEGYDYNISAWGKPEVKEYFKNNFTNSQFLFFQNIFDSVHNKNVPDIWDFQWWFHRLLHQGIGITPKVNLTLNIGFTADATHTFEVSDEIKNNKNNELDFPLNHPTLIELDSRYDKELSNKYYEVQNVDIEHVSFYDKLVFKIKIILSKLLK